MVVVSHILGRARARVDICALGVATLELYKETTSQAIPGQLHSAHTTMRYPVISMNKETTWPYQASCIVHCTHYYLVKGKCKDIHIEGRCL